jgi:NTE family protein
LVLSGGGARAAYEVGVLKAMYGGRCPATRGQNPPEVFCGTGAGGFNAAVIAGRLPGQYPSPVEYLESLWADEIPREGRMRNNRVYRRRLDTLQFLDIPFMWRRPLKSWLLWLQDFGLIVPELIGRTVKAIATLDASSWLDLSIWHDTSPMRRLISESVNLGVIREGANEHRPQRLLRVIATERGAGKPHIFSNADFTEEDGYAAILASCALPIIFPSVTIKGKEYLYGGLVMQTPLQPAVDAGCTVIHLIHNEPRHAGAASDEAPSTREALNRTLQVALSATLERDLESRARVNMMLDLFGKIKTGTGVDVEGYLQPGQFRRVQVHQYRPSKPVGGKAGLMDFTRPAIEAAIAAGERDAAAHNCAESGCIL